MQRMYERGISAAQVRQIIQAGLIIESYPNDTPYPSRLILGWVDGRPIHVVVAYNAAEDVEIVITTYEPDRDKWESGFRRRKP